MMDEERRKKGLYWDKAWSLVEGCTPAGPSCRSCWSAAATHMRAGQSGKTGERYGGLTSVDGQFNGCVRFVEADLEKPLKRRRPTVYAVWNDLFHEGIEAEQIDQAVVTMQAAERHTYLILTKRIERALDYFCSVPTVARALAKQRVYIGTTAPAQPQLEARIGHLVELRARFGFKTYLSLEPLLGPLDFGEAASKITRLGDRKIAGLTLSGLMSSIDQVIVGGETGPRARPMHPEWVREVRRCCSAKATRTSFYFKGFGGRNGQGWVIDDQLYSGRQLDGHEWNDLAWDDDSEVGYND